MYIEKKIIKAQFINRPNRFKAYVKLNGEEIMVHVPNTGRCREILTPNCTVLLRKEDNPSRKTQYDLIAGYKGDKLINIDSQAPNAVVDEALKQGKIEKLRKYKNIQREKTFGSSRFDFKLTDDEGNEYFLEVKGVTLEMDGKTMFPDAPTERGAKHMAELGKALKEGKGAGVLFLIQMSGAESFSPNDVTDKNFSETLRFVNEQGIDVFAYECIVTENSITLNKKVPVVL
ncbi:DNA/RNA nuclease SfsA [Clostridium sp. 19966]|uniref:DNA/RNA nuclease SfsA n=1 Tax=Clostridium sp. 19966 TaxID=2768166 RepID=UPI0028E033A0|nr:DNA/RNA nuclease SfsA [Clostridium sp. 19966]MDT8719046.1 DNA/RNA nuclease SfsA [Clostridium sp. 19966]